MLSNIKDILNQIKKAVFVLTKVITFAEKRSESKTDRKSESKQDKCDTKCED